MSQLTYLDLYWNAFYGPLDKAIGQWPLMQYLCLAANSFSGSIPASLGNLTQLVSFDINANMLVQGVIPPGVKELGLELL